MDEENEQIASSSRPPGIGLQDIALTLIKHKWLIAGFVAMGVLAASAVRFIRPPLYISEAKLLVRYIVDTKPVGPSGPGSEAVSTESNSENLINSEVEILQSLDVATEVARNVGPKLILAKRGGGEDLEAAAGVVSSGIDVKVPPRTQVITVTFKHPDKNVVQPVLQALIDAYVAKHQAVHGTMGVYDAYYEQQCEDLKHKLEATQNDLKRLQEDARIVNIDEAKRMAQNKLNEWQEKLHSAEVELVERKALMGENGASLLALGTTNINEKPVPQSVIADYGEASSELQALKKRERDLLRDYKEEFPLVITVRGQIAQAAARKTDLETQYPSLTHLESAASTSTATTNAFATDVDEIRRLTARITYITNTVLPEIQAEVKRVFELEPKMAQLQAERDTQQTNYVFLRMAMAQAKVSESLGSKGINMNKIESPTPPDLDRKKLLKLVVGVFLACSLFGFALAFLIDFVLERKIRRATDVERSVHAPVFLTIKDSTYRNRLLSWKPAEESEGEQQDYDIEPSTPLEGNGALAHRLDPWDPDHHLREQVGGLRERLVTYFEVNQLNTKKPKLVAMTSPGRGAGVSTLAAGLAASLSEMGEGNVLLVDMTANQGNARSFYKGRPGHRLSDALEGDTMEQAQVQEHLYVATMDGLANGEANGHANGHANGDSPANNTRLARSMQNGFTHLVPKLKASDYDYIIFDMPPVSPSSATPRLASHMDLVLLVLESEKTGHQVAAKASALLKEAKANVATVLNKYRDRLPSALSHDI